MQRYILIAGMLCLSPAAAQDFDGLDGRNQDNRQQQPVSSAPVQTGRTADITIGDVGQRQTPDRVAPNIDTQRRIENRIANRVQSRIRNRIDRYYDPQANTKSPFKVADDQLRRDNPQ
uniref:hypothetical protein n=1 Tax=Edaphosphingomonas laterariae TaxID=861865 RepID=UPI0011819011|nr:hypothetical protein [Sphingomonas laterariae]